MLNFSTGGRVHAKPWAEVGATNITDTGLNITWWCALSCNSYNNSHCVDFRARIMNCLWQLLVLLSLLNIYVLKSNPSILKGLDQHISVPCYMSLMPTMLVNVIERTVLTVWPLPWYDIICNYTCLVDSICEYWDVFHRMALVIRLSCVWMTWLLD